jgi:hypothetical protein
MHMNFMPHIWLSHATHTNESCHTYDWVISHIWLRRVTRCAARYPALIESCHAYDVALCCNVLQRVAVRCSALQRAVVRRNVLQCVTVRKVCCNVLQSVARCWSVLQGVAGHCRVVQCVAVGCGVLRSVAVRCSVLQCIAVCCSVLQCVIPVVTWHDQEWVTLRMSKWFQTYTLIDTCTLSDTNHGWSGKGLQHLLGATKRAFSLFDIFWNSDYRQRIPFNILKLGLSPEIRTPIDWNLKIQKTPILCIEVSGKPSTLHPWYAWVTSHIYVSCDIWISHVTFEWVTSCMNEPRHVWMPLSPLHSTRGTWKQVIPLLYTHHSRSLHTYI